MKEVLKYRAEIDGLRAIAVLAVTLYHFFPYTLNTGFKGYLGVDIFFVISGFLITKYIYTSIQAENFSFKEFYWRRVKRILPAAFFVLLFTAVAAIFVLTTNDLITFFKSQLAALTFIPNIFFWRTGGYFGGLDALKPLLHFWSLGVEEQFYLFFPLMLFLSYKFLGNKSLFYVVTLISIISLVLNIFLLKIGGANPAFFLLPTRVWEFGVGCLGAILADRIHLRIKPIYSNFLLMGLTASLFISLPDVLPQGLLPVIFTGVILFYHHSNGLAFNLLSNNISIFFGKISFSLYLIHWPVVVFMGYIFIDSVPEIFLVFGLGITVFVSYLNYRFIEIPFRHQISKSVVKRILLSLLIILSSLSFVGISTNLLSVNNSQLISNLSSQVDTNYRCPVSTFRSFGISRACVINGEFNLSKTEVVLLGNSHAQMYTPIVKKRTKGKNGILVPLNGCLPTTKVGISFNKKGYSQQCLDWARSNKDMISKLPSLETLIIGMTWYEESYFSQSGKVTKEDMIKDLLRLVSYYESLGINVYVISPLPIPYFNHASDLSRKLKFGHITEMEYSELSRIDFSIFYKDIMSYDVSLRDKLVERYIKTYEDICDEDYCYFGDLGGSYFSDDNHLSSYGISLMESSFEVIDH